MPKLLPNEIILFDERPKRQFLINLLMLIPLAISLYNSLRQQDYFILVLFALITLFVVTTTFLYRLTLTNLRLIASYGPFYKQQVWQRNLSDTVSFVIPAQQVRIAKMRQRYPSWLVGKLSDQDFKQQRAQLIFPQNNLPKTKFREGHLLQLNLFELNEQQQQQVLQGLKDYWSFDPERLVEAPDQMAQQYVEQDIGKRAALLMGLAVLIAISAFCIPIFMFQQLHFAVEPWWPLAVCMVAAFILCYWLIRQEGKKMVFFTSLIIAAILGGALYFTALQLNRAYSEQSSLPIHTQMTLSSIDDYSQLWQLEPALAEQIGLSIIYVHKDWYGYPETLKVGQRYPVTLQRGYFDDYFIDEDSFSKALAQETP